ncbi:MAG: gamma-glutamyltransferase [Bdellovibrionales bacterium]|nr:gamma-glutamyltransferase [Bdellovibrionales bacterium]
MKLKTTALLISLFFSLMSWAVPFKGHKIVMAGPSPYATAIGQEIAEKGGNVVDVAVAVGIALAITSPYYASLGGGGFAMVKMPGQKPVALDFREVAPSSTHPKFYIDKSENASREGGTAIAIPGIPAGYYELHKKYGRVSWSELLSAPLRLAENGFRVSGDWVSFTQQNKDRFNSSGKKFFFKAKGREYLPGEILKQPQLAKAIKLLQKKKRDGFYKGEIAKDLVNSINKEGGTVSLKDFENYQVRWLKPLSADFRGYKVYMMPPPSSGGIVMQTAFHLMDQLKPEEQKHLSVNETHLLGEILSRAYRGRALLGDPDFYKNPLERILSKNYLSEMAHSVEIDKTRELEPLSEGIPNESNETTHFSVLDKNGASVAMTITLNGRYGSGVVSRKYGIALNNEMDDFTTIPGKPNMFGLIQGNGNIVEPGKRPLSSMSPTLVEKGGKVVLSIGAPGGPRIISSVIQVIYRVLVRDMNIDEAIQAPRVHHQFLPRKLYVDSNRWSPESLKGLRAKGHQVEESWMGRVYAAHRTEDQLLEAAYDARGEGAASGY